MLPGALPPSPEAEPGQPGPTAASGAITGNLCLVDAVDLVRIEELFGVPLVYLAPDEHVEQVGIDVAVFLELAQDLQGVGQRLAFLVRSVPSSEGLEDVGDTHDPRLHRHLFAREAARIALSVHALE